MFFLQISAIRATENYDKSKPDFRGFHGRCVNFGNQDFNNCFGERLQSVLLNIHITDKSSGRVISYAVLNTQFHPDIFILLVWPGFLDLNFE